MKNMGEDLMEVKQINIDYRNNDIWEKRLNELREFKIVNKRHPSESSDNEEEKRLAQWFRAQVLSYEKGSLSLDRVCKLDELDKLDIFQQVWQMKLNEFMKFVSVNGRYPSNHSKDKEERILAIWVSNQRQKVKKGKISLARYKLLRRQRFIFDSKEEETLEHANEQFFEFANKEWSR